MKADNKKVANPQWWLLSKPDVAKKIYEIISSLYQNSSSRRDRNIRCARMYGNTDFLGGPYTMQRTVMPALPEDRVKINIISSMSDTVTSKVAKNKPRVTFLTEGGSFSLGQNAQKLSKYILGAFVTNGVYDLHQKAFLDAAVFDIGAIKHYIEGDRIVSERVMATELLVDNLDAMYGDPRSLYQIKFINKEVLKQLYPKSAAAIAMSSGSFESAYTTYDGMDEYVVVMEAWHLPSTPDSDDGRHVLCTSTASLCDEPYTRSYFPFTFQRWSTRLTGFWGQSLADRLVGVQLEINKLLRFIQKSFHLGSAFKVFLEHGSKIAKEHLNNEIGSIVYYTGTKPSYEAPKTVNNEVFTHLQFLIHSAYEEAGISQLSATSRKPAGIDSGKALREYNDIESERFATISQSYEASFLETAKQYCDLSKELHEMGAKPKYSVETRKFMETIEWKDVNMDSDQYIMQMFPVSMLPHTPAGRMQFVQELINEGFIPREFGLKLLDFPDLESYTNLSNAPLDDILDTIDMVLVEGTYRPPEPMQDLQNGLKLMQAAYLRARNNKVPEQRLELARRWMSATSAMLTMAQPSGQQLAPAALQQGDVNQVGNAQAAPAGGAPPERLQQ